MGDPDGVEAKAQLPDGVLFGSAMSTHKAQGSQFDYSILTAERGYKNAASFRVAMSIRRPPALEKKCSSSASRKTSHKRRQRRKYSRDAA
jgi:hypothetical protein